MRSPPVENLYIADKDREEDREKDGVEDSDEDDGKDVRR